MPDAVVVRAGWIGFVRVHGLTAGAGVARVGFRCSADGAHDALRIELFLAETLNTPLSSRSETVIAVLPGPTPPDVVTGELFPEDPPGAWVRVSVTREFHVPRAMRDDFDRTGDAKAIDALLVSSIDETLSPAGPTLAWRAVQQYSAGFPELRATGRVYERTGGAATNLRTLTIGLQTVQSQSATVEGLSTAARDATALFAAATTSRFSGGLRTAAHYLLHAGNLRPGSSERFMGFFIAVEALCSAFLPPSNDATRLTLSALRTYAATIEDATSRAAAQWLLDGAQHRVSSPELRRRFEWMARETRAENPEEDIKAFKRMNNIRVRLVHGGDLEVPGGPGRGSCEETIRSLAVKYHAAVSALAITSPTARYSGGATAGEPAPE